MITSSGSARLDREFRAALALASRGLSPLELGLATLDWISHLAISPGRRLVLAQSFIDKLVQLGWYGARSLFNGSLPGPAAAVDPRISGESWQKWPFNVLAQGHQLSREWWQEATRGVEGVRGEHEAVLRLVTDQMLELASPANFPLTNPEVLQATRQQRGRNLARGLRHLIGDLKRNALRTGVAENDTFVVGDNLATTPGKVVFQNELIELIQYRPATAEVGAEPVLICPAWILKYYILDLSPHNSLAHYLTAQGKTVFMISWKNPGKKDRDIGFEDYITRGMMEAVDAVSTICPAKKIHAVGYCIGGTLLAITAAAMARDNDTRLQTVSLFAAQTDFSEAGDISSLISASQLSFLEKLMWKQGYLSAENMGGAFSTLLAGDLIYGAIVDRYLLGKSARPDDIMAWNADGTRLPHRMHSEYLEQLYLHNELARNRFRVGGRPVCLADLRIPLFVLGTETDYVAPWRSVYKIHNLTDGELTFALTSGGHNAGVVSGPVHPRRHHRTHTRRPMDKYLDPDSWLEQTEVQTGSWWPTWNRWLEAHMSGQARPPRMGAARRGYKVLRDAPGEYVFG